MIFHQDATLVKSSSSFRLWVSGKGCAVNTESLLHDAAGVTNFHSFKDTLKAFDDFKSKQQKSMNNVF